MKKFTFCLSLLIAALCSSPVEAQNNKDSLSEIPKPKIDLKQFDKPDRFMADCNHGHICCAVFCRCCPREQITNTQELDFDSQIKLKAKISMSIPTQYAMSESGKIILIADTNQEGRLIGKHLYLEADFTTLSSYSLDIIDKKSGKKLLSDISSFYKKDGLYFIIQNKKFGILDSSLQWKLEPKYYKQDVYWPKKYYLLDDKKSIGLIDSMGNWILAVEFDEIEQYTYDKYLVKKNGLESLLDKNFETIIPFKYKEIQQVYYLNSPHYRIKNQKDNFGIIDSMDQFKIQPEFETIRAIRENQGYEVQQKQKWGFFSPEFELLIPVDFDSIYTRNCVFVQKNNLWGFYELDGTKLSECKYQLGTKSNYGFYHIHEGNKSGLINPFSTKGPSLIPAQYILISGIFPDHANQKTYFVIRTDKKYGILEARSNKEVVPMEYDEIRTKKSFHGTTKNIKKEEIYLRKGDKWALFKGEGIPLNFTIDNISEEINRDYQFRQGIRTSLVFD